jgi:hypothetical protein
MLGRFTVGPSDDGSGGFGVWDGAVNGWRATGLENEEEANELATDLDVQYDAHGPRAADKVRHVRPITFRGATPRCLAGHATRGGPPPPVVVSLHMDQDTSAHPQRLFSGK